MAEKNGKDPKEGKDKEGKDGKEGDSPAAEGAPAADGGKKKKLIIIGVAAALVLGGGGGGAAWYMARKKAHAAEAEGGATEQVKVEPKKMPVFVDLESFTVNLHKESSEDIDRFMQIKLVAEAKDAPAGEVIKSLMPAVRNEVILLLGSKRPEEVESREGKEALVKEIMLAANKPLARTPAENGIEAVNITHIIVQ